ncbi:hypothetical protein DE146DRAFT_671728 [Phaeosphaeria sp. MPI-PUGE-AT-0046c]|nr:hypothetical protein DE146DRAFT_671728 [Phaeosphaeria sp. MPI-PUGE-AT-0046c]
MIPLLVITASESKSLLTLSVSTEEITSGLRWTGIPKKTRRASYTYNPAVLALFDIPQQPHRTSSPLFPASTRADLSHYLGILIEAAVYRQQFWRGYFFPSADSKLASFYDAYSITKFGLGTPPHLTEYKRPWTYSETRLLQRGQLVCNLLKCFESNNLTDFGIIRAVRGSFVRLPGQPHHDMQDLSNFLYHRVVDSGLPLHMIPEILALHPEHDEVFANARLRALVREHLREKKEESKREEEVRIQEIRRSKSTFEEMRKKEMGRWRRAKGAWKKWFGKKEVDEPFDPFSEE